MKKNKVTSINRDSSDKSLPSSLDDIAALMLKWRNNKKSRSEKIPENIWDKIFVLLESIPSTRICKVLGITSTQMRDKIEARQNNDPESHPSTTDVQKIDFCEVDTPKFPLDYKPAQAYDTRTSVVEIRRPDGMLMKIHICTDRFDELLSAFYRG